VLLVVLVAWVWPHVAGQPGSAEERSHVEGFELTVSVSLVRFLSSNANVWVTNPYIDVMATWFGRNSVRDGRLVAIVAGLRRFEGPVALALFGGFLAVLAVAPDQRAVWSAGLSVAEAIVGMLFLTAGCLLGAYRVVRGLVFHAPATVLAGAGRLLVSAALLLIASALGLLDDWTQVAQWLA
jgi:hypothetical protein